MRIDGPKGLGSWLQGWFSGSFRGNLEGTASFAETASYVDLGINNFLNKVEGGTVEGPLILSGSSTITNRLTVHGGMKVLGTVEEGKSTEATGEAAHAEGIHTIAAGVGSHAEGRGTRAIGVGSHAEGRGTRAIGIGSHAEGEGTVAAGDYQTVVGRYNIPDPSNSLLFIVGNGTSDADRSNAFSIGLDGTFNFGARTTVDLEKSISEEVIVKSKVTKEHKVKLEYEDESENLLFTFIDEDIIQNQ